MGRAAFARVAGLGLAAALVAACSGSPSPVEPPPVLLRSAELRLPIDDYLLSPVDLRQLAAARVVLVRQCMNAAGLDLPPPAESRETGPRTWNERRYGITDPDLAAVDGFGLGDRDPAAQQPKPAPKPDAAQRAALDGPGGCVARADRDQRRDSPPGADRDLPRRLSAESFDRSGREPTVRAAVSAWSECMRANGLNYDDPLAPLADARFAGAPTEAEITAATADVECKRRTNLVGVWFTAESAIQRDLTSANREALQRVRQANEAELRVSRQVAHP
ncbi:MAG TPA: hypothetical protein VFT95_22960 [Micromonosporaceae bacterium]|nr:hypothetical protein [Micromonosporaceae bacterium]